jgi:hypothetical protein
MARVMCDLPIVVVILTKMRGANGNGVPARRRRTRRAGGKPAGQLQDVEQVGGRRPRAALCAAAPRSMGKRVIHDPERAPLVCRALDEILISSISQGDGARLVGKLQDDVHDPGSISRGVRAMTAIVSVEPLREVACEACVVPRQCFRVLQDVHDSLGLTETCRARSNGCATSDPSPFRGILCEGELRHAETAASRDRARRSLEQPVPGAFLD